MKKRVIYFGVILTVVFLSLMIKVAFIQLLPNQKWMGEGTSQYVTKINIGDSEIGGGEILDRNFIPLTNAKPLKKLVIINDIVKNKENVNWIITNLTYDKPQIIDNSCNVEIYNITKSNILLEKDIRENKYEGILIMDTYPRYDDMSIARHVVGYVRNNNLNVRGGIEDKFFDYLNITNYNKYLLMIKDGKQNLIPELGYSVLNSDRFSSESYDIQLTIDYYIQREVEKIIDGEYSADEKIESGAVVVMDVNTGDILAMASRPNFDQNNVGIATSEELWNKTIQAYPPGSIFKIVVAAAALEDDNLDFSDQFYCNGSIDVFGTNYSCHSVHGTIDVKKAFAYSCNCTFIQIGENIGGNKLEEMARNFGFGQKTGIQLPGESSGLLPTEQEYINAGIGNFSIGQGKVEASPIQIAKMISIIANGGIDVQPNIINAIIKGDDIIENINNYPRNRIISINTSQMLKDLMREVTINGSAKSAYSELVGGTAGKTGTPQLNDGRYAAWFAGYFPENKPKYAIVVFDKLKQGGGKVAAPIFKRIAESIFLIENK